MSEDPAIRPTGLRDRLRSWYRSLDPLGRQRLRAAIGLGGALIALLCFLLWSDPGSVDPVPATPAQGGMDWIRKAVTINAILVAILLLTSPAWVGWAYAPAVESPPRIGRPVAKLSIFFLLVALTIAICLRLPLMDRPIQETELDHLSQRIHGYTDLLDDGSSRWRPVRWGQVFCASPLRNQPILATASAKASLDWWRWTTGLEEDHFHPVPIRLPSLIAGLASIVLLWRMLHWFGYRCAALFAAFFFSIHPAAIELDVGVGSASLSIFFELLALSAAYLALRTLKWRYWSLYGASTLLCLYANPGGIYLFITTSLCLAIYLFRRVRQVRTRAAAWPQLVRFGLVSLLVAMGLLFVSAPAGDHLREAKSLATSNSKEIDRHWSTLSWQYLTIGTPLPSFPATSSPGDQLVGPARWIASSLVSPALLLVGLLRLVRGNRFATPLVLGAVTATALAGSHMWLTTFQPPSSWQLALALPTFILLFSIGLTSLSDLVSDKKLRPYCILASGAGYLVFFSLITRVEEEPSSTQSESDTQDPVEFQRKQFRWRCYDDGRITREPSHATNGSVPTRN